VGVGVGNRHEEGVAARSLVEALVALGVSDPALIAVVHGVSLEAEGALQEVHCSVSPRT